MTASHEPATQDPRVHQQVQPADEPSVAELVTRITENTTALFRKEVELAKAETREEVVRAGTGAGMLAAAGVSALLILVMLSFAAAQWLSTQMDLGWAYLVVAGVWLVLAVILGLLGRARLKKVNPVPERTAETLREIPDAVRGR
jgi:fatty acid desaturase